MHTSEYVLQKHNTFCMAKYLTIKSLQSLIFLQFLVAYSKSKCFDSIDCIMFKTEISTWFGFTAATEQNQATESKVLRCFVQFFISLLFVPNVSFLFHFLSGFSVNDCPFINCRFFVDCGTDC